MSSRQQHDDEIPWYVRMLVAERDFEIGDPLAVDNCVLACSDGKKPIPEWAMPELARRSEIALGMRKAPPKRGGPHSNPRTVSRDRHKRFAAIGMVLAAKDEGVRGERAFEIAKKALELDGIHYAAETLERYWKENRARRNADEKLDLEYIRRSWTMDLFRAAVENILIDERNRW